MEKAVEAEVIETERIASKPRKALSDGIARVRELPVPVLIVSALIIAGGSGGAILYGDDLIEWIHRHLDIVCFDSRSIWFHTDFNVVVNDTLDCD